MSYQIKFKFKRPPILLLWLGFASGTVGSLYIK